MLSGVSFLPHHTTASAVILLHGYGSNGADLINLAPRFFHTLLKTAFFAPNAPRQIDQNGFEWFSLNDFSCIETNPVAYTRLLKQRATQQVPAVIEYLTFVSNTCHIPFSRIVLGGFSQGGLMAFLTAYSLQKPLAGIMGLSAVPLTEKIATTLNLPVLLTHGTADSTIPIKGAEYTKQTLEEMGQSVRFHQALNMEHGIDDSCVTAMQLFLKQCLENESDS